MLAHALAVAADGRRGGEGEEPDPPGEAKRSSGRSSASSSSSRCSRGRRGRRSRRRSQDREDKIRGDLERAESVRRPRPRPRSPSTSASWPRRATRPVEIIEEARQAADQVRKDLIARAEADAAEIAVEGPGGHPRSRPSGRWPTCRAACRRAVDRARGEGRRAEPGPRHADRSSSRATSTRWGAGKQWPSPVSERIEAYARGTAWRSPGRKGMLGEVEDDLFRFARVVRGQRRPADGAHRPVAADGPSDRGGRGAHGRQGAPGEHVAGRGLRRCGVGRAASSPAIVDRFVELAAAERGHEVAEVRSAIPLDDAQQQRLAAGAVGGDAASRSRSRSIVDADGARRDSSPASATPSSTARSVTGSSS